VIVTQDVATPRSLPTRPAAIFAGLLAIGVITLLFGASSSDPELAKRTYRVFLHNWLFWAVLSNGALVLSSAMRLTNARWQGPIQRVAESMGAYVPVSVVLFAVIYLGRHSVYAWVDHPVAGKEFWYEPSFAFTRDTLALCWIAFISIFYLYLSIRPMLGGVRESATGLRRTLYQRWTAGWRGEERERDLATRRARKLAAVLVLSYAICYSLIAIDLVMSLAPEWVSTMFPAYYSWGGFLCACTMLTLICLVMRNSSDLKGEITPSRMHDMGKMIFAFSIFWMYLFWSQYFVIWYANIPEETGFIVNRLGTQFIQDTWYFSGFWERLAQPYVYVSLSVWFLIWVFPFWVLLGQKPKKTPAILGPIAFGSLLGFWLERYILVTPSLVPPKAILAGAAITPFSVIELGIAAGFVGLFFLCFLSFAKVFPGALPAKS
jgi:Ni/Fe-hydrogenase subunit HybB-like protein